MFLSSVSKYYTNAVSYILHAGYSFSYDSFFHGNTLNLNAPIVLDGVDCYDTEAKLTDCNTYEYGTYESYCNVAAGVMCEGSSIMYKVVYTK